MGGFFLASQDGGEKSPLLSYSEIFDKFFPYYLSWGMTEEQYWNGDASLAKAYRTKHKLEIEQRNQELWMQGLYIYEALLSVSPMFHDFAKNPKPLPYRDKPFPLTKEAVEKLEENKVEETREKDIAKLTSWMERVNKKMRNKNE